MAVLEDSLDFIRGQDFPLLRLKLDRAHPGAGIERDMLMFIRFGEDGRNRGGGDRMDTLGGQVGLRGLPPFLPFSGLDRFFAGLVM